ncbi:MAG TPA: prolipoprotein diacylglyceryl transferase family protein [Gemmataceae bacterium]|nr:prolipoprotein diacylglyceryl transferase family protein [Gemmataceae bacterium]
MQQVLFRIPIRIDGWLPNGIPIYGFGAMLFLTFLLVTWLACRRAAKEGISKEFMQDLAMWLFIGGIVGARLSSVILEGVPLWQFFMIWDGGLILYGSIIGGLLTYLVFYFLVIRRRGISAWKLTDAAVPCFALGICLGRIGCLLNGCCYGSVACPDCPQIHFPFSSPARLVLVQEGLQTAAGFSMDDNAADRRSVGAVDPNSPAARSGLQAGDVIVQADGQPIASYKELQDYLGRNWPRGKNDLALTVKRGPNEVNLPSFRPLTLGLHPTQLYESISMLLLFGLLLAYYPFRRNPGELAGIVMAGYGIHRYLNELLRADPRPIGFERYISVILVGLGVALWIWRRYMQPASSASVAPPSHLAARSLAGTSR